MLKVKLKSLETTVTKIEKWDLSTKDALQFVARYPSPNKTALGQFIYH